MPRGSAERELLAPTGDVWTFLADPHHLTDWWPNLAAVRPDRRGAAAGARWEVQHSQPGWFRRGEDAETLLVTAAEERRRFAFELVRARVKADLRIEPIDERRSAAHLDVEVPWLAGSPRTLAANALSRLHDLCQTAADR